MIVCSRAYVVPVSFNYTGKVNYVDVAPNVDIQVGYDPGADVIFDDIHTTIGSPVVLKSPSCEYSSFCSFDNGTYADFGYVRVSRVRFDYVVNESLEYGKFALWPGSDWAPAGSNIMYCPPDGGFVIGEEASRDLRCYKDVVEIKHRDWQYCFHSPFDCVLRGVFDDQPVDVKLSPFGGHLEVSSDLYSRPSDCIFKLGHFHTSVQRKFKLGGLVRDYMIEDSTLPNRTVRLGVVGSELAYTWLSSSSLIYVDKAWNHDGHILYIDFIIGAVVLYVLKVWFSWIITPSPIDFAPVINRLLLGVEILASAACVAIFAVHIATRDLGQRFFRVSTIFVVESADVFSYIMLGLIGAQFCVHMKVLFFPGKKSDDSRNQRKYCFETNLVAALSLLILNTHKVGFLNVLLALMGIFLLYRRHEHVLSMANAFVYIVFYIIILFFVVGVLFPPLFQSMSGFSGNEALGSIYAAVLVILGPGMYDVATK